MKVLNYQALIILTIISLSLIGCSTIPKTVYFQGDTTDYVQLDAVVPEVIKINSNDILGITVTTISEESNKLFELPVVGGLRYTGFPNTQSSNMGLQPLGYEVDSVGNIELPLIGKVKVSGLSCSVASDTLRNKLNFYLKAPTVNIRILNHKFTILGEVNRPATYNILDNNLTIPEALGMAGDLTIFGKRENISLIRVSNGKRFRIHLNLLKQEFLSSPYYYVKNGDIIYVEPSEVKSTYNDRSYQMLPIVTSIVSAVTSLGVLILSLSR
ncbi:polysaccharide biosynthesis/export family protein [Flectobacillus roseus]|uniref:polysaccharide biosynthesis/export family protein n=1 Tax=Flectobacillus roseus TaxID=502259 RepID=UPI0024B67480|nr:polysaccharide biosynthesis/export family protein [Flectobacillus roseus]MDI9872484.1 polysaccharide biosynthesis/export family protein [Flectobacillus roseus]